MTILKKSTMLRKMNEAPRKNIKKWYLSLSEPEWTQLNTEMAELRLLVWSILERVSDLALCPLEVIAEVWSNPDNTYADFSSAW